jgi:ribonuclease R
MSGPWNERMEKRIWSKEIMEIVHAEGYEAGTFRDLRHLLNVPKDQVPAVQDALMSLIDEGKIRIGSRDRIHAVRDRPTRAERNKARDDVRDVEAGRRQPKQSEPERLPREGSNWKHTYTGPSWKAVQKLFADAHELPGLFPRPVKEQADKYKEPTEADFVGRRDCRQDEVYTIDPWNAHDHDDAVGVETHPNGGWRLDVHIADVSHYVTEASPIDKQAVKRSFTTYLPWTAVTMLPQNLAADLCSLLDGKDRLALSCRMEISPEGQILSYEFFNAVVNVRKFLSYEQAQELGDKGDPALARLKACSEALLKRRQSENLLEFDLPEPKVVFDKNGEPIDAQPGERLPSHRWVEEAMLAANRCCASMLDEKNLPGLYRVHEPPEMEAIGIISDWAAALDLPRWSNARGDKGDETNVRPQAQQWLAKLLRSGVLPPGLQGKIIRSMKKARYSPDCRGHFALGWLHYAHYTSPIRRYPDLWTHRVIKEFLKAGTVTARWSATVRKLATHVSGREDATVKAERSGNKACAAWILKDRVGDVFEAEVTGVEPIGVFLLVKSPWAEGMMHVRRMTDDFYEHLEERMELKGRRTGKSFKIGDIVQVRLAQADPVQGWVDFEPNTPIPRGPDGMPLPAARPDASGMDRGGKASKGSAARGRKEVPGPKGQSKPPAKGRRSRR